MYRVLRTIDDNGQSLTHLPTADRLVGDGHEDYLTALAEAKSLRTALYRHKVTGETRVYSELDTTGCAYREDADEAASVWRFVKASVRVESRGYALAVEEDGLSHYELTGV